MSDNDLDYTKKLEEELKNTKQIIASLEQTIKELKSQSSAAEILLKDFHPGSIV